MDILMYLILGQGVHFAASGMANPQLAMALGVQEGTMVQNLGSVKSSWHSQVPVSHKLRFQEKRQCSVRSKCSIRCNNGEEKGLDLSEMDRRMFLLSSGAGFSSLVAAGNALADPIQMTGLDSCKKAIIPTGADPVNCCPPQPTRPIKSFVFPTNLPMRVRPAAHLVDKAYAEKYNRAYQLLRALPDDDPRKFAQQANVHCAYCESSYVQPGTTNSPLLVHDSWFFLPWHRWYLYFHERILASVLKDDSFALPFWNWDNQTASSPTPNVLPPLYVSSAYPSLQDSFRDKNHLSKALVDLNYSGSDDGNSDSKQRKENNALMYQQIVSGAKTPSLFFGGAYRYGDARTPGAGTLENAPHGPVHVWTGSSTKNREDMGSLYSAARDPIFFAHHANVDRMWTVWKTLPGGRRTDFTDPDWLNAQFLFYDENADLVKVSIKDCLSPEKLRFSYQPVDTPWVNTKLSKFLKLKEKLKEKLHSDVSDSNPPSFIASSAPPVASASLLGHLGDLVDEIEEEIEEFSDRFDGEFKTLKGAFKARVKRPAKHALQKLKKKLGGEEPEEVLVIEGVEVPRDQPIKFEIFINLPNADENTPRDVLEYAGTYFNIPHFGGGHHEDGGHETDIRIGIGDKLEQLGIKHLDDVIVTLVPRGSALQNNTPIVVKGIKVEYE